MKAKIKVFTGIGQFERIAVEGTLEGEPWALAEMEASLNAKGLKAGGGAVYRTHITEIPEPGIEIIE